jgi:FHA domain
MREALNVADKRCDNGHFIDESWDLCPYCPGAPAEPEIPVVRPTRFGAQEAPRPTAVAGEPPRRPTAVSPPKTMARRDVAVAIESEPVDRTVASQKLEPLVQPKRYVVGWLIGLNGSVRGESFPVRVGRNVLGRDRRSDIVVNDDQTSSHHADLVFRPEERRFILMDHNSTNGTYVNESEIEPRRDLATKDIVRVGSHKFLFMPLCSEDFYWDEEGVLQ